MHVRILLSDLIRKKGVTKKWVSEQTGIREGTIRDYCQGWATSMNVNHIGALCTVFDCKIYELLQLVDDETGQPVIYPKNLTAEDRETAFREILNILRPWSDNPD